ncbi:hypothetical protein [Streptomyces fagopyri]
MRKVTTALQAAVVTTMVAKRPALDKLPVRWELSGGGKVSAELDVSADTALVPQIADEVARAMRGAETDSYDIPQEDGTVTRAYEVRGRVSGVLVHFLDYQRGIRPAEGGGE